MDSGTESVRKVKTEDSKQKQKIESKIRQQKEVRIDYNEAILKEKGKEPDETEYHYFQSR